MRIRKGDVFMANLYAAFSHEQQGRRPVLVLQNDIANDTLPTVMVAPVTSNLQAMRYPSTVFIQQGEAGLTTDSVALVFQTRTLDKRRLEKRRGKVSTSVMAQIDQPIRTSFDV